MRKQQSMTPADEYSKSRLKMGCIINERVTKLILAFFFILIASSLLLATKLVSTVNAWLKEFSKNSLKTLKLFAKSIFPFWIRKKIIIIKMRAVIKKELWKGFEPRLKWYKIHYCNDANLFSLQRTSKKNFIKQFSYYTSFAFIFLFSRFCRRMYL